MAESTPKERAHELLLPLERAASRRLGWGRRVGSKARLLARLARDGLPVPRGWVLEAQHYQAHLDGCLPPKHDLRSLIKLSGTGRGDDRCARAREEIVATPLAEPIIEALGELVALERDQLGRGVIVRASLAASGELAWSAVRQLGSRGRLHGPAEIAQAIVELWADSVLARAVADYARAELKDVAVAILIQRQIDRRYEGVLTRTTGSTEPLAVADWHLGCLPPADAVVPWQRWGMALCPLSLGEGCAQPPPRLGALRERLGEGGFEQLIAIGEQVEGQLGRGAEVRFAVTDGPDGEARVQLLGASPHARWQPLAGGDADTVWTELTLAGRLPAPPTRLTQSVLARWVRGSVEAAGGVLRASTEPGITLLTRLSSRSYLNLTALTEAAAALPLIRPEDLLHAVGGATPPLMASLVGHSAARRRARLAAPITVARALREQHRLQQSLGERERRIEGDALSLGEMDLALLPDDAMATTLRSAQALVEQSVELWSACAAAQLSYQLLLQHLIRRRLPDANLRAGYAMQAGAAWSPAVAMAFALQRTADMVRGDAEAVARICAGQVRDAAALPDGRARGAVGHFLTSWGHACVRAFELSAPRWREDARDAMQMLAMLLSCPAPQLDPAALRQAVRAAADAELARHEPALGAVERRLLRALVGRSRGLAEQRASLDDLLWRTLATLRAVVLDVDRRLRRVDPALEPGGVFHCSVARLERALESGRPELGAVIRMRQVERQREALQPAAPLSIRGAAPVGAIPLLPEAEVCGLGVSPGVVEGRVRLVSGALPAGIAPDDVLVLIELDPALSPVIGLAGAVVCETGGALSLGAELCRAQSVPAVMSATQASLQLAEGEPVRVDGDRGVVQRLQTRAAARGAARSPAPGSGLRSEPGAA